MQEHEGQDMQEHEGQEPPSPEALISQFLSAEGIDQFEKSIDENFCSCGENYGWKWKSETSDVPPHVSCAMCQKRIKQCSCPFSLTCALTCMDGVWRCNKCFGHKTVFVGDKGLVDKTFGKAPEHEEDRWDQI